MKKLSPTMEKALEAIRVSDGAIHYADLRWWRNDNVRLFYRADGVDHFVKSNTIYALLDRGYLEKIPNLQSLSYRLSELARTEGETG